jgi:hypothetical protein
MKPDRWLRLLHHYPDRRFPQLLANIAIHDTRAGYEGPVVCIRSSNHPSAFRIADEITNNIQSEVLAGKVQRVHTLPQFY